MRLNFKFSNLLGTVYRKGNIIFTPDGDTVISPVGNKITFYNLKDHRSHTLPIESNFDITLMALDIDGNGLLVFDESGESYYVSLISQTIIHRYSFYKHVKASMFSPDKKYFVVCRDTDALLFRQPGLQTGHYNPFFLERTFALARDSIISMDWSSDSKLFVTGSTDMMVRVCGTQPYTLLNISNLSGHASSVVGCFFEENSYDLYSVECHGYLMHWKCSFMPEDLILLDFDAEEAPEFTVNRKTQDNIDTKVKKSHFRRIKKFSFYNVVGANKVKLINAAYHRKNHLLFTGHSNGNFIIHEMPDFNLIHSLNVSEHEISSLAVNSSGDWLGVASSTMGQLLVWEWQSETFIMKQQGHFHDINCMVYSPDGQILATGGKDAKVKLWTVHNGFCFATFNEHSGNVTGVAWTQGGKAIVSSSLDGTVRAFDLARYRNFRTFVSPSPVQFGCVCVDHLGDLICAGCHDVFDIYVWSINTGKLLEILTGHEAPVSSIRFNVTNSVLASGSWDKTLRIWDIFEGKRGKEVVTHSSDVLCVEFSPDGRYVACCTLKSQIFVYDWRDAEQIASIDCTFDLDPGRGATDEITAKKLNQSKAFTTISFSANGEFILAGGLSRYICLYHVREQVLVKKYAVTCNRSIDYVADDLDHRKMSEFGNLQLIDTSDSDDESKNRSKIKLPGVRTGDTAQRSHHPEVRVFAVHFSPTGRAWSACTTEGLLIYSLDQDVIFDPYQLATDVTPARVSHLIQNQEYTEAVVMVFKLNQTPLIVETLEKIPSIQIDFICRSLPLVYVEKLLTFIGGVQFSRTVHVEYYVIWIYALLSHHAISLKSKSVELFSLLTTLQQSLTRKQQDIRKLCEHNKYSLNYFANVRSMKHSGTIKKEEMFDQKEDEANAGKLDSELLLTSSLSIAIDNDESMPV